LAAVGEDAVPLLGDAGSTGDINWVVKGRGGRGGGAAALVAIGEEAARGLATGAAIAQHAWQAGRWRDETSTQTYDR
jgi:hypothetical protein